MRIDKKQRVRRGGFTLLEVLLASGIAILLFGGLYFAMEMQFQNANAGREVIEQSTLARSIFNRISIDLAPGLTSPRAILPTSGSPSGSGGSGASGGSGGTSGGTGSSSGGSGASGGSGSSGGSSGSSSGSSSTSATPTMGTPTSPNSSTSCMQTGMPFPVAAGVYGMSNQLVIFTTRMPDPRAGLNSNGSANDAWMPIATDVRQITYWQHSSGKGLCRQEYPWFLDPNFFDPTVSPPTFEAGKSEDDYLIAPEVGDLMFEYYDINTTGSQGGGWNPMWDGTQFSSDGVTPWGPPTAIRVSFSITTTDSEGKTDVKLYKHVIPIVTSVGPLTSLNGLVNGLSSSSGSSSSQASQ